MYLSLYELKTYNENSALILIPSYGYLCLSHALYYSPDRNTKHG